MSELKSKYLNRRDFLRLASGFAALTPLAFGLPRGLQALLFPQLKSPGKLSETSTTQSELERMGVEIDLEGLPLDWPKTPEAAANLLKASTNSPEAEKFVPVVYGTSNGKLRWSGEWMGEMWPVNEEQGIHYDPNRGIHIDATGKPLIDIRKIFDFSQTPNLKNVQLNSANAALYAGRGFETRDGLPQYTGYFAGSKGAEVRQIEQLTIMRPEMDSGCDPQDYPTAALTRAARQSVREFRDSEATRNGERTIQWFNPETGRFQEVQGRGVAEMAKQGIAMPFIDKMPAGFPLSAKEMSDRIGGNEDKWVFDPEGIWNYEAWDFIPGVRYVPRVGHFDQQGHILVGANRVAYGNPGCIFDYSKSVNPDLMFSSMNGPGSLPASLFVRVGGDVTDTKHPQSWYTSGHGNITVDPHISTLSKAEQAKLVIVDQDACPPYEGADMLTRFNMGLGQDEKRNHPGFKVMVWDEEKQQFIIITNAIATATPTPTATKTITPTPTPIKTVTVTPTVGRNINIYIPLMIR